MEKLNKKKAYHTFEHNMILRNKTYKKHMTQKNARHSNISPKENES